MKSNMYKQILLFILVLFLVFVAFFVPLMNAMASSPKLKALPQNNISIFPAGLGNDGK